MRVLLADDQAKVRSAMRLVLEQDAELSVLGEAVDATGLLDWVGIVCPDLILLDWELPGQDTEDVIAALREDCSRVRIIALSGQPEARREALEAGADGFVSKGDPPECLLETIRDCATIRSEGAIEEPRGPEPSTGGVDAASSPDDRGAKGGEVFQ